MEVQDQNIEVEEEFILSHGFYFLSKAIASCTPTFSFLHPIKNVNWRWCPCEWREKEKLGFGGFCRRGVADVQCRAATKGDGGRATTIGGLTAKKRWISFDLKYKFGLELKTSVWINDLLIFYVNNILKKYNTIIDGKLSHEDKVINRVLWYSIIRISIYTTYFLIYISVLVFDNFWTFFFFMFKFLKQIVKDLIHFIQHAHRIDEDVGIMVRECLYAASTWKHDKWDF